MADNTRVMMSVRAAEVITVPIDDTLSVSGQAADAKATGDALALKADAASVMNISVNGQEQDLQGVILVTGEDIPVNTATGARTLAEAIQSLGGETAETLQMSSEDQTTIAEKISELETAAAGDVKSVNGNTADENGNVVISSVPFANNLTSDSEQSSASAFVIRTTGGSRSVRSGNATLQEIRGVAVHTGYVPEVLNMSVSTTAEITATIDREEFIAAVSGSTTMVFTYTTEWDTDPGDYGITVEGTPANGDTITVVYVEEDRGTITVATPTELVSTGWNLFNYSTGYARVVAYDGAYHVGGTYTSLKYSETLNGAKSAISVSNSSFTVPGDGYVWVEGGNATNTYICTEWSDWTNGPDVPWEAYSESKISLAAIMNSYFPNGLMAVGAIYDSIAVDQNKAISRIEQLEYTAENLAAVISAGRAYDADENYIYAVRTSPVSNDITVSGTYTVNDHGMEMFNATETPAFAVVLYGQDLKAKLTSDVLTISQQTLNENQKKQVIENLGLNVQRSVLSELKTGSINANNSTKNSGCSLTLEPGIWLVSGNAMIGGSVAGTRQGISLSTSPDNGQYNAGCYTLILKENTSNYNEYYNVARVFAFNEQTTLYLMIANGNKSVQFSARMYATRLD